MRCKPEAREERALDTAYQMGWGMGDEEWGGGRVTCDAGDKVRLRANPEKHLIHSKRYTLLRRK